MLLKATSICCGALGKRGTTDKSCICGPTEGKLQLQPNTVNREIFVVKIFSDSVASAKIKRRKSMRIINDNAVRPARGPGSFVRKLFNTKIYRTKYL